MANNKLILLGLVIVIVVVIIIILLKSDSKSDVKNKISEQGKKEEENKDRKGSTIKNEGLPDYDEYFMNNKEMLMWISIAAAVLFIVGFIFYRSVIFAAGFSMFSFLYPKYKKKEIIKKRKNELNKQFKEALYALSSSLSAGKSVSSAFEDSLNDLAIIYEEPDTFIIKEFQYIIRRIKMNETVEDALNDFAKRSHLEDIKSFADVFVICTRTGGDLKQVLKNTSDVISDKIEIKQDIETQLSEKKLEGKMLSIMPIAMVLFLSLSAADFMAPVFTKPIGKVAMTVALILIGIGTFISKKIMDIEV